MAQPRCPGNGLLPVWPFARLFPSCGGNGALLGFAYSCVDPTPCGSFINFRRLLAIGDNFIVP